MVQLEHDALMDYWEREGWPNMIVRWARIQLPNGQWARSIWSDSNSKASLCRTSCVEVSHFFFDEQFTSKTAVDQI